MQVSEQAVDHIFSVYRSLYTREEEIIVICCDHNIMTVGNQQIFRTLCPAHTITIRWDNKHACLLAQIKANTTLQRIWWEKCWTNRFIWSYLSIMWSGCLENYKTIVVQYSVIPTNVFLKLCLCTTPKTHICESYNCMQDCLIDEISCNIYNFVITYNNYQHCQHGTAEDYAWHSSPNIWIMTLASCNLFDTSSHMITPTC